MQATINFKWEKYAYRLFLNYFYKFLIGLGLTIIFALDAAEVGRDDALEHFLNWRWGQRQGISILLWPVVTWWTWDFLQDELTQLRHEGA